MRDRWAWESLDTANVFLLSLKFLDLFSYFSSLKSMLLLNKYTSF